jgi:histidyl-tRNA synthetase
MKTEAVKGFNDYSGEEARKKTEIRKILAETFERFGFEPAETPIIEYEEFVKGENPNDEAVSNIFKLQDRGKRKLALRYEFTFQLNRLAKNKKLPYKRYQIGEVFRDEPVSANRFRQFTQCDIDVVGSTIKDEAEILAMVSEILNKLGIKAKIYINNRKLLNEIFDELKIKNKEQAIREFDKLDKLPEKVVKENLKKYKAEKVLGILKQNPEFFRKYISFSEIEELIDYCKFYDVEVKFAPFLARGLSYYNGTIFEIKIGSKDSVAGGGSYMVDKTQATGISFGLERLTLVSKIKLEDEKILIISLNQDKEAIKLSQKLRKKNRVASIYYGKPSKALEYANSYNFQKVIFVGSKEVKAKKFKIKDMKTGAQSRLEF